MDDEWWKITSLTTSSFCWLLKVQLSPFVTVAIQSRPSPLLPLATQNYYVFISWPSNQQYRPTEEKSVADQNPWTVIMSSRLSNPVKQRYNFIIPSYAGIWWLCFLLLLVTVIGWIDTKLHGVSWSCAISSRPVPCVNLLHSPVTNSLFADKQIGNNKEGSKNCVLPPPQFSPHARHYGGAGGWM